MRTTTPGHCRRKVFCSLALRLFSENHFAETPENNCQFAGPCFCKGRSCNELQRRPNGKELARFWPKIWPSWPRGVWPNDCLTPMCRRKPFHHSMLRNSPKTSKNAPVLAPGFRNPLRRCNINSVENAATPRAQRRAEEIPLPVCRTVRLGYNADRRPTGDQVPPLNCPAVWLPVTIPRLGAYWRKEETAGSPGLAWRQAD